MIKEQRETIGRLRGQREVHWHEKGKEKKNMIDTNIHYLLYHHCLIRNHVGIGKMLVCFCRRMYIFSKCFECYSLFLFKLLTLSPKCGGEKLKIYFKDTWNLQLAPQMFVNSWDSRNMENQASFSSFLKLWLVWFE